MFSISFFSKMFSCCYTQTDMIEEYYKLFPITNADIIAFVTMLTVIVGGIFTYRKWKNDTSIKRAEYINVLSEKVRSDETIRKVFYMFEYGEEWYNASFHGSGQLEYDVDKTLSFFSYICYLENHKIISKDEFDFLEYLVTRILQNIHVQYYLYNIYHFAKKFNRPISFSYLIKYGLKNNLLSSDFTDRDACDNINSIFYGCQILNFK